MEVYGGQNDAAGRSVQACGKTTLISIIAGLLDPTHGEVEAVLGQDLRRPWGSRLVNFSAAAHIGFVFQQYNLLPRPDRSRERGRCRY